MPRRRGALGFDDRGSKLGLSMSRASEIRGMA
jgi:hypothetical protein